jgi:adenine phosphoribosyltransferase/purine operon repressor
VIAKRSREVGVTGFIEEVYVPGKSGMVISLYVPRDALKKADSVLIVDDIINVDVQMALARIIQRAKGEVAGVYTLISAGTDETVIEQALKCPVEIVYRIGEKPLKRV